MTNGEGVRNESSANSLGKQKRLRVSVFTEIGIHYKHRLAVPGFPILLR